MDYVGLRNDPKFRKLSYSDQRQLYASFLQDDLKKDATFLSLSPQDQSSMFQSLVMGWKPALNAYDGTLTDQDRQALQGGFLADVPGTQDSYKRALWLRERLDAGDATAVDEAQGWIVRNSVGTKSLLIQAAAGVKDAIETLFGGDPMFNDLRLNSQDYQKLTEYLLEGMPSAKAKTTQTLAGVAGMGAAIVENVALNFFLGGSMATPGLFTKGIWGKAAAKSAAERLAGKVTLATTFREPIITGVSGGIIDLVRSFPRMVETGVIQGPKEAFGRMASVFGEGFLFDFGFQAAKMLYRFTVVPMKEAFKFVNPKDAKSVARVAAAMEELDSGKFGANLASMLNPNSPPELIPGLSKELQEKFIRNSMRVKAMMGNPTVEFNTEAGLKKLAFGMGEWDVRFGKNGIVEILDDSDNVVKTAKSTKEAYSWMLAQGPLGFDDMTDLGKAMSGGSPYGRLKVYGQTTTHVSDLPDKHLIQMTRTTSFKSGTVDEKSFKTSMGELLRRGKLGASTKINFIDEDEFLTRFGTRPPWETGGTKWTFWKKGEELYIPKTVTKEGTTKALTDYLQPIYSKFGANTTSLPLTVEGLNTAMNRIGGKIVGVQGRWELWVPGQAKPTVYTELSTLNRDVWGTLLESGAVDVNEFNKLLMRSTGFYVKVELDEMTGLPLYEVRSGSTVLQTSSTLKGLSDSAVTYNLRLPEDLLPDMMIGKNSNIEVSTTMATGTPRSLLRYLQDFKETGTTQDILKRTVKEGKTVKRTLVGGTEAVFTYGRGNRIVFENPATGVVKEFSTTKELKEFLEKLDGTWQELDALGASKGFRANPLPNGGILFASAEGSYVVDNYDKAIEFLSKQPSLTLDMPELVSIYGDDADRALFEALNRPFDEDLDLEWKTREKVLPNTQGEFKNFIDYLGKPAIDRVKKWAVRYNAPYLTEGINNWETARAMYGSKVFRDNQPILKSIFTSETTSRLLTDEQRRVMSQLLERDEGLWGVFLEKQAKNFVGDTELLRATKRVKNYLEALGKVNNIDILGFMTNYMPHLRNQSAEAIDEALKLNNRYDAVRALFGKDAQDLPIIKFLSRNTRMNALIGDLQETDALKIVEFYVGRSYRDLYLKPAADFMHEAVLRFAKENPTLVNVKKGLDDTYGAMVGGIDDALGRTISSASLDATRYLSKGLSKVGDILGGDGTKLGKKFEELAKKAVTADMVGDISQNLSLATLGFRSFRALSNTAQYMNTISVFGRYAFKATEEVDDAYILAVKQRGILDDKIFSAGDTTGSIKKTLSDIAFKPQQSSEHLTRAWTARTAQDIFDDYLPGLRAGNYDFTRFAKLTKIRSLSDGSVETIRKLMAEGNIDTARDYFMRQAIRELMFDYTKENAPHLFTGTMGRLFGKFGVYPAGQINLYRNIIRGFADDPGEAFLQVTRLVTAAAVIRNAFLAAGIDYSGFKLTDPFAFHGGPLWSAGIDFMSLGDDGPRGDLARRDLMRNWLPIAKTEGRLKLNVPRLAVPGGLQIQSTVDGFKKLADEDYWGTFLDFVGAPDSQLNWTKPVLPF